MAKNTETEGCRYGTWRDIVPVLSRCPALGIREQIFRATALAGSCFACAWRTSMDGCMRGAALVARALAPSAASSMRCWLTALRRYASRSLARSGGRFAGDIVLSLMGRDLCVEARADGFRELYCWLNQRDVLIVKANRQEPLVVVRLSLAAQIAQVAV